MGATSSTFCPEAWWGREGAGLLRKGAGRGRMGLSAVGQTGGRHDGDEGARLRVRGSERGDGPAIRASGVKLDQHPVDHASSCARANSATNAGSIAPSTVCATALSISDLLSVRIMPMHWMGMCGYS